MHTRTNMRFTAGEMARSPWRWGWRSPLLFIAALLALLALSGCTVPKRDYRFRMTVEVETPEGIKTGSSVYEAWAAYIAPGQGHRRWRVAGEAGAVDLPGGRTLFALLKTNAHFEDMVRLSMQALDPTFTGKYDVVGTAAKLEAMEGKGPNQVVDPATYPMLVTFRDIDDPTSVELVDPTISPPRSARVSRSNASPCRSPAIR